MHVADLQAFNDGASTPLSDVEGIFRALVGYPSEEAIEGASAADLSAALDRACKALASDDNLLPGGTLELIAEVAPEGGQEAPGTYSYAAKIVGMCPGIWRDRIYFHAGGVDGERS